MPARGSPAPCPPTSPTHLFNQAERRGLRVLLALTDNWQQARWGLGGWCAGAAEWRAHGMC